MGMALRDHAPFYERVGVRGFTSTRVSRDLLGVGVASRDL